MRAICILSLVVGVTLVSGRADAQTAVSVNARIGDFHVAVSNYYHVPEREVVVIRERRISEEELPVVLFIAQRASVSPARIVDMRLSGRSWWDISVRYGIGPEVYYVPVTVAPGPPYGHAYGHYKKSRKHWNTIVLSDDDVVKLVYLRFASEYYRVPAERVIERRGRQGDVVLIHAEMSNHSSRRDRDDDDDQGSKGHGKGRGRH